MAVNKLKKINVRSPYYISVAKPVSEGGEGDEPDVIVTQPVVLSRDTSCGATEQVGVDVGIRKYNLTAANKQLGDYTITFSNIKVPIKFRIGHSDNMPAFTTAGLDTYASVWNTATGESPTLSSASSNPNGVSATATYTSTQSDLDTYGDTITLEIQQPIIVDQGYSFVSSCPSDVPEQAPDIAGYVTVLSVMPTRLDSIGTWKINNFTLPNAPINSSEITRYIFSDISPDLIPKNSTGNFGFINETHFGTPKIFIGEEGGKDVSVEYLAENKLSRGTNTFTYTNSGSLSVTRQQVVITRHPVEDVNGTLRILGSSDGVSLQRAVASFLTAEPNQQAVIQFDGGNTQPLSNGRGSTTFTQGNIVPAGVRDISVTIYSYSAL